jgi:addiction module RelE/StbE family toxin
VRVRWATPALLHLTEIAEYIAQDNPPVAKRVVSSLRQLAHSLRANAYIGRIGRVEGTRELAHPSYPFILAYRVQGREIQILAVLHTARRWPHVI